MKNDLLDEEQGVFEQLTLKIQDVEFHSIKNLQ